MGGGRSRRTPAGSHDTISGPVCYADACAQVQTGNLPSTSRLCGQAMTAGNAPQPQQHLDAVTRPTAALPDGFT